MKIFHVKSHVQTGIWVLITAKMFVRNPGMRICVKFKNQADTFLTTIKTNYFVKIPCKITVHIILLK